MITDAMQDAILEGHWCMALHGNHDEHQCHKKPGHGLKSHNANSCADCRHECYCGVVW